MKPLKRAARWLAVVVHLVVQSGCGDSGSATEPEGDAGGPAFTARIDGQEWSAEPISIASGALPGIAGGYLITGGQAVGGGSRSISITLANIAGPGTYPLGVETSVFGGRATVGDAGAIWRTPDDGLAGTIVITTLEATRIVATFQYTAAPGRGNPATTSRVVTEGRIDLPLSSSPPPVSDAHGSKATAELNGQAWAAADVSITLSGAAGFGFSALTDERILEIGLESVTEPGTYALSRQHPFRSISLHGSRGGISDPFCCYGSTDALGGTITITSITETRVKGSFTATLEAEEGRPATGEMAVTNGSFDVGLAP